MTYSEKLRDPRWQKKRLQVLSRDEFKCRCCGDKETELHVHHKFYKKDPWDVLLSDLMTVCKCCHSIIEFIKKNWPDTWTISLLKLSKERFAYFYEVDNTNRILIFHVDERGVAPCYFLEDEIPRIAQYAEFKSSVDIKSEGKPVPFYQYSE